MTQHNLSFREQIGQFFNIFTHIFEDILRQLKEVAIHKSIIRFKFISELLILEIFTFQI